MITASIRTLCLAALLAHPSLAAASYAKHEAAQSFVNDMAQRHGFDTQALLQALSRARHDERVIRLIAPPSQPGVRNWQAYRSRFLGEARIAAGLDFWQQYEPTIRAASARFGVPAEVIVAIIGVETHYGNYTGNFETVSALATLAFDYPPRAPLFRKELENLFLLAREQNRDPFSYTGSFAGALGYPQFLPSSIRTYAVDFDGDGRIDFESDPVDAIGSVANYLAEHGWRAGEPVAVPVWLPPEVDAEPLVGAGIEPTLTAALIRETGMVARRGELHEAPATLVNLPTPGRQTDYWLGYQNFSVITRYHKSRFYAMSVHERAEVLRARFDGDRRAQR